MAMAALTRQSAALANKVYNGPHGQTRPVPTTAGIFGPRRVAKPQGAKAMRGWRRQTGLDLLNHPDLVNDPQRFLECGVADFILCGCLSVRQGR